MRLRVLYTNGTKIQDLFWLSHNGTDVYCGPCGVDVKRSYHESGKVHMDVAGKREHHKWHLPLAELRGGWNMMSQGWRNEIALQGRMNWPDYHGKKGDLVMSIDGRSIPKAAHVQLDVGLAEPNSLAGIPQLNAFPDRPGRQLLMCVETVPWVYALLMW